MTDTLAMATLNEAFTTVQKALTASSYEWPQEVYDKIDAVSFTISNNKRVKAYGRCWYTTGHLEVYPHNFKHNKLSDMVDTLLHEYAHYLTWLLYETRGHNKQWKQLCRVVGCDHMATHDK